MVERVIGIIGGSGLYQMEGLTGLEWRKIQSPFGPPSDALCCGRLGGVNVVGMKRRGFTLEDIQCVRRAYKTLFSETGTLKERIEAVASEFSGNRATQMIVDFLREGGDRSVVTPRERRDETT